MQTTQVPTFVERRHVLDTGLGYFSLSLEGLKPTAVSNAG